MPEYLRFPVRSRDGSLGTLYSTSRFLDNRPRKLVRLEDGREFLVPAEHLRSRGDDSYVLDLSTEELERYARVQGASASESRPAPRARAAGAPAPELEASQPSVAPAQSETVIPTLEEELRVDKREVETGKVLVHKRVAETEAVIDETLQINGYDVKRIPINRLVEETAGPRQQGDTTIIPLFEEILVVEKRLILREEVHITRTREEVRDSRKVPVRSENVEVERVKPARSNK